MSGASHSQILRTIPFLMAVCFVALPATAKYSGGSGTAQDPYQIATAADLIALGETPEDYDKHFLLTADIDLDPNLPGRRVFDRPVIAPGTFVSGPGYQGTPFTGVFDGNGRTISHLRINGKDYVGLFGRLGSGAEVRDLGVVDVNVIGAGAFIGGLVGVNSGAVTQCYSTGAVSGDEYVGGLVGDNRSTVIHCYSTGAVSGDGWNVGGLVGINSGAVTQCYSSGSVSGTWLAVGGLVGWNHHGRIATSYSSGSVSGYRHVGGLVGSNEGDMTQCYSTGAVSGDSYVGGLVGNNGNVDDLRPGGSVTDCYSSGSVSGKDCVGGLVGLNQERIATSYSSGSVNGTGDKVGGLVGDNMGSIAASFWDTQTSGRTTSAGGTGKTTAQMQTAKTFLDAGWDFVGETANGTQDIWAISEGVDYPNLAWQFATGNYSTWTVVISSSDGGKVTTPGEGSFTYPHGSVVVPIQATAAEGYLFVSWTGTAVDAGKVANPRSADTTLTVAGNYTLQARFGAVRTLTVLSSPNGVVTAPGEGVFTYGDGAVVPIQAAPGSGYRFARWLATPVDAGKVANPVAVNTTVTIEGDCTVVARFAPLSPIYVDADAAGADDGSSWADAYASLQDALASATSGCEVRVAQGVYRPDRGAGQTRGDRTAAFHVVDGVQIRGAYAGFGGPDPNARDVQVYKTVLSGDLDGNDSSASGPESLTLDSTRGENSYHVLVAQNTGDIAVLDGLTIEGGNSNGGGSTTYCKGGGIYLYGSNMRLVGCTFTRNSGGYYVASSPNSGTIYGGGGGMYNDHSNPTLVDCTFSGNATGYWGGGMHNEQSNPRLDHCTFDNNFAQHSGAAINNRGSSPVLVACTITTSQGAVGMSNTGSSPIVVGCAFIAHVGRGAVVGNDQDSNSTFIGCEFSRNNGIPMMNAYGGNLTIVNSVFSFNTGGLGGALQNEGNLKLINCTFNGNKSSRGGAIYTNCPVTIINCILWNDTPVEIYTKGASITVQYSDVQGGWPGQGNINKDPLFAGASTGDYYLKAGSPCIDTGISAALPGDAADVDGDGNTTEQIPWDFAGARRIIGPSVDMGAYEFHAASGR